jgi:plasmid stabilization system protein ParE
MKKAGGSSPLLVKWIPPAIADFDEIVASLAQFSVKNSEALGAAFLDATEPLRAFPRMGRLAQGYDAQAIAGEEVRELLVDDYRLGYRFRGRTVRILYIAHMRRDFPRRKRQAGKSH